MGFQLAESNKGARVRAVYRNNPADKAGIRFTAIAGRVFSTTP